LQSSFVPQSLGPHAAGQVQALFTQICALLQLLGQVIVSPHEFFTVPQALPEQTAGGGGAVHFLHPLRTLPQPSATPPPLSQTPGLLQVSGVQPQVLVAALHSALLGHCEVPQSTVTPQPLKVPHLPVQSALVGGTQAVHWCVLASQICGAVQVPQSMATPHESWMVPHCAPAAEHSGFFDSHWWVSGLQTSLDGHAPQLTVWPQLSIGPQAFAPMALQTLGTQPSPPTAPSGRNTGPESLEPSDEPPSPPPLPLPESSPPPLLPESPPPPELEPSSPLPAEPSPTPTLPSPLPIALPSALAPPSSPGAPVPFCPVLPQPIARQPTRIEANHEPARAYERRRGGM
jgi:hypothetical protein